MRKEEAYQTTWAQDGIERLKSLSSKSSMILRKIYGVSAVLFMNYSNALQKTKIQKLTKVKIGS